jgi:hypothetical protein
MSGKNNLGWGINPAENLPSNTSSMTLSGSVHADPLLLGPSLAGCPASCATDLHLSASNSGAQAAGSSNHVPTYDHDGFLRSNPPSIGAYEFAAAASTKPYPPTNLAATVQ